MCPLILVFILAYAKGHKKSKKDREKKGPEAPASQGASSKKSEAGKKLQAGKTSKLGKSSDAAANEKASGKKKPKTNVGVDAAANEEASGKTSRKRKKKKKKLAAPTKASQGIINPPTSNWGVLIECLNRASVLCDCSFCTFRVM